MPSALVTGAAGFIGTHLVERLSSEGVRVLAVDCLTSNYDVAQKQDNVRFMKGMKGVTFDGRDLRSDDFDPLLEDVDVVFHLAATPGVRTSWAEFPSYLENNVRVVHALLEAARKHGPRRLVFASSSSVYGQAKCYPCNEDALCRPQSPYGVTKLAAEDLCWAYVAAFQVPVVALRYFTVYGPRQRPDMATHRLIEAGCGRGRFSLFGDGSQVRDFTYVADVVDATVRAAEADSVPGTVYNVAGGSEISMASLIDLIGELLGKPVPVDHSAEQPGDVQRTGGDVTAAATSLGWKPRTNLREGLVKQIAWHRERRV